MTPFPDLHGLEAPRATAYDVDGTGPVSYGELVDRSRRIARLLRDRDIGRGDVVAILLENRGELLDVAWAAQRSGLRYTPLSTRLHPEEITYILRDSGARALVTSAKLAATARAALTGAPEVRARLSVDPDVEGFEHVAPLLGALSAEPIPGECEGLDLLYSSGTTGRPKAIVADLPFAPLGTPPGVAELLRTRWGFGRDTVYLSPAPLYHAAPLRFVMTVHRYGGQAVVMDRFDPVRALDLIQAHGVTHVQMVPTMMVRLLKLPPEVRAGYDLSSLRYLIHAAAPCPPAVKSAVIDWLGPVVEEYYGATENYLFTAISSQEALEHPGSVGRALDGTPHILDEDGAECPPGTVGTLWASGGHHFEYLNDPVKTAAARNDRGWTTVGDLARLDDDGYLYVVDRKTDMIISGGVNVYPQETESVLITHPAVTDVAVFGIPEPELGEVVHAVVRPAEGTEVGDALEAELIAHCRNHLAAYKAPRRIDFRDELPRLPTGKLLRRVLRDEYAAEAT